MRVILVLFLMALVGAGGYAYVDLNGKFQRAQKLHADDADANAKARKTLDLVCSEYASAPKVENALDNLQKQINTVRNDLGRVSNDYASAQKVDAFLRDLQTQVTQVKNQMAEVRTPTPAAPEYLIELGFYSEQQTTLALRYAGASLRHATSTNNTMRPGGRTLVNAVKVDPGDATKGTVRFNYVSLRTSAESRFIKIAASDIRPLAVVRPQADSTHWELAPDRTGVANWLAELEQAN